MNISFVGIVIRPESPEAEKKGFELAQWLNRQGIATTGLNRIDPSMDLIVVLGGDGTLLHAADAASQDGLPVLGVNMGNLGFLSEIAVDELYKTLTMVLAGESRIEKRIMLRANIINGSTGAMSEAVRALNEVVIGVADTGDHVFDSGLFIGNVHGSNIEVSGSFVDVQGTEGDDEIDSNLAPELVSLVGGSDTVIRDAGRA